MGLKYLVKLLRRFRVVILVTLTFVVSVRAHCECYGVQNAAENGGWQLHTSDGGCLICFFGTSSQSVAELVLPCWDQNQKPISQFMVSYIFRRPGKNSPLSYESSDDTACEMYANDNRLRRNTASVDHGKPGNVTINVEHDHSYHLKASGITPQSFICLTDVKYFSDPTSAGYGPSETTACTRVATAPTLAGPTPSSSTASTRVTTAPAPTLAGPTLSPTSASTRVTTGLMPTGTGISTAATPNTTIVKTENYGVSVTEYTTTTTSSHTSSKGNQKTALVSVTEYTATTTSSHTSSKGNQKTALEQRQSKFPIWVIFVIIAIVISICAIAVVVFRRRKQHDHQQANNVNTGRVNDKSNLRMDNMKNDKGVIANPTYGQEPVIGKEEEYHSYTEIDVKIPDNSKMIYNSAYESTPASSDMVYNSAYESTPASSDMVYNSAYESPAVTSDMVYNSAYESSPSN